MTKKDQDYKEEQKENQNKGNILTNKGLIYSLAFD